MHESEKWKWSHSAVCDSYRTHGLHPTRLLHPWDFPGTSTGVGCRCLLRSESLRLLKKSESVSHSVVSNCLQPYRLKPARLFCPWDSPGKNTGVGYHALLQGMFPTQGSNPRLLGLLHWQVGSLLLVPPRKPLMNGSPSLFCFSVTQWLNWAWRFHLRWGTAIITFITGVWFFCRGRKP